MLTVYSRILSFLPSKYRNLTIDCSDLMTSGLLISQIIEHPRSFFYVLFVLLCLSCIRKFVSQRMGISRTAGSMGIRYLSPPPIIIFEVAVLSSRQFLIGVIGYYAGS